MVCIAINIEFAVNCRQFKPGFVVPNIPFIVCKAWVILDGNTQNDCGAYFHRIGSGFHSDSRLSYCKSRCHSEAECHCQRKQSHQ